MKLRPIFSEIKSQVDNDARLKLVTWWNNQLESGTIHTVPAAFISFPDDINPETLNDQVQQGNFTVRVTLVSKLYSAKDGSVSSNSVDTHEDLGQHIYDNLEGHSFGGDGSPIKFNSLERSRFQLDMDQPGWMITIQDFTCMIYQQPVTERYTQEDKPPLGVVNWP